MCTRSSHFRTLLSVSLLLFSFTLGIGDGVSQVGVSLLLIATLLLRPRPTVELLGAFILFAVATAALSPYGWPRSSHLSRLYDLSAFFLGAHAVRSLGAQRAMILFTRGLSVALACGAIYGIAQYYFGVYALAEWLHVPEYRWQIPLANGHFAATGFFHHRLKFASALLVGCIFLVQVPAFSKSWRAALFALLGFGLLLSHARAAAVALAAALSFKRPWVVFVFAVVAIASPRLATIAAQQSYSDRVVLWERAVAIASAHPWLGIGYGNYSKMYDRYYPDDPDVMRAQAHNQFLTVLVEMGPLGLLLFLAWIASVWRSPVGVAFVVLCLTHDPLFHHPTALLFCAALGLERAARDEAQPTAQSA